MRLKAEQSKDARGSLTIRSSIYFFEQKLKVIRQECLSLRSKKPLHIYTQFSDSDNFDDSEELLTDDCTLASADSAPEIKLYPAFERCSTTMSHSKTCILLTVEMSILNLINSDQSQVGKEDAIPRASIDLNIDLFITSSLNYHQGATEAQPVEEASIYQDKEMFSSQINLNAFAIYRTERSKEINAHNTFKLSFGGLQKEIGRE